MRNPSFALALALAAVLLSGITVSASANSTDTPVVDTAPIPPVADVGGSCDQTSLATQQLTFMPEPQPASCSMTLTC